MQFKNIGAYTKAKTSMEKEEANIKVLVVVFKSSASCSTFLLSLNTTESHLLFEFVFFVHFLLKKIILLF